MFDWKPIQIEKGFTPMSRFLSQVMRVPHEATVYNLVADSAFRKYMETHTNEELYSDTPNNGSFEPLNYKIVR